MIDYFISKVDLYVNTLLVAAKHGRPWPRSLK